MNLHLNPLEAQTLRHLLAKEAYALSYRAYGDDLHARESLSERIGLTELVAAVEAAGGLDIFTGKSH